MIECANCGEEYAESKVIKASNDERSIYLCGVCTYKQSNAQEVADDI